MMDEERRLAEALSGRYRLDRVIGEGGMGRVFLGHDLRHDRPVAIKVLRPEVASSAYRARFAREIDTVAALRHPHILPLIDSGEVDGVAYLITPFIEGETLRQRLDRESPLPIDEAFTITRDLAEGLAYAHAQGHVHRDIKPTNVLLSDGHAIIADFGVARAIGESADSRLSSAGLVVGSPHYMSPEQAGGDPIDGRSDLYSLACLVYEMLAGQPPFTAQAVHGLMAKHMLAEPPDVRIERPAVPDQAAQALFRAMSKVPTDRHADTMEFYRDLSGGSAVAGSTWGGRTATRLPVRRRSSGRRLAFAGGIAVLLGAAWLFGPGRSAPEAPGALPLSDVVVLGYLPQESTTLLATVVPRAEDELTRLLSGWDGMRVVGRSEKDGLRDRLGSSGPAVASLDEALAIAREAGVSALLSFDLSVTDAATSLHAQLYDVASGQPRGDPMLSNGAPTDVAGLVAPIAAQALDLAVPPNRLAELKRQTTDLAAVRLMHAGRGDLEQWRLESAERSLRASLARDSLFASAHHVLALTLYWRGAVNPAELPALGGEIRRHLTSARRLGSTMSDRDRAAVEALYAFQNGEYDVAREGYEALVASDSTDVYAWLMLGSVEYQDPWTTRAPDGGLRPRGSFNRAADAFVRAIRASPDFYLGFGHLLDIYRRISRSIQGGVCYGYEPPGAALLLPGEVPTSSERVVFCPIVKDSIELVDRETLDAEDRALLLDRTEDFLDRAIVELRRWASYAPDNPWPHSALAQWHLARAELRAEMGSSEPWGELLAEVLPFAEYALDLQVDTVATDLATVGTLRLARGDFDGALRAATRALELARETGSPPPGTVANPLIAAGQVSRTLGIVAVPRPDSRMTVRDAERNPVEVQSLHLFARLQVYGATGFEGEALRQAFEEIERGWADEGFTDVQTRPLRRALLARVQAALVLDPVALELWREGWEDGGDPILAAWHGVQTGGGDPEEARSAVEGAIADGWARQAFLAGLLAQSVGEHEAAISAFEVADRARMSIDVFSPDWAVRTRSWLARARSYEALGDSVSARSYYSRFAEAWREADPEVAHLREEATAAINRLRAR